MELNNMFELVNVLNIFYITIWINFLVWWIQGFIKYSLVNVNQYRKTIFNYIVTMLGLMFIFSGISGLINIL